MSTPIHRPLTLLVGLLLGCFGSVSDGECLGGSMTTISGHVRAVEGGTISEQPNARFTVVAIDEQGRIVARESTDDAFHLTVPTGHDYVLMVSEEGGESGLMVWGDDERPEFAARGMSIDLGYIGLNSSTNRAFALRELDLRPAREAVIGADEPVLITEE
ncbi:MAG: hypothetical protein PVF51_08475 [Nitrospirota bacterium]